MAKLFGLGLMLSMLTGCHRSNRADLPDLIIPKDYITQNVVLHQCDTRFNPPHCKSIKVTYRNGEEIVVVKR